MVNRKKYEGFSVLESLWTIIVLSFSMGSLLNVLYMSFKFHSTMKMRLASERNYIKTDEKIRDVFESLRLPWWDSNPEIMITENEILVCGRNGVIVKLESVFDNLRFLEVKKDVENDVLVSVCIVYSIEDKLHESRVYIGGHRKSGKTVFYQYQH